MVLVTDGWELTMWVLGTDPSPLGKEKKTLQSHLASPTITASFKDYVLVPRFAIPGLPHSPHALSSPICSLAHPIPTPTLHPIFYYLLYFF